MIQASILTMIVLWGSAEVWQILVLITTLGIINAFDVPARQVLVHQLVDKSEDVSNAVALNSSIVNIARLVGPALSGLVLNKFGAGICFFMNALSYLAVIISLLFLKLKPQEIKPKKQSNLNEIKEGFDYLKNHSQLAVITVYMAIVSLLVLPYDTLLPEFAKEMFHGNAQTYGYIYSCIGAGAIIGSVFLASLKEESKLANILYLNAALLGGSLITFSFMHNLAIALVIAVVSGFGALTQSTVCLTLIQTRSAPNMRGRVISLFAMALFGMLPLGGLLVGYVSHQIGSSLTMAIQGVSSIIIAAAFYWFLKYGKSASSIV
jgi:predicted MFS family arabinose efflux permease